MNGSPDTASLSADGPALAVTLQMSGRMDVCNLNGGGIWLPGDGFALPMPAGCMTA